MLFNSIQFLFFFIGVTAAYFLLPSRYRWMLLLAASCYFYMAFVPIYIMILIFTIIIDYFAGIYIERTTGKRKKWLLIASIVANVGVLAFFKYYNFLNDTLTALLHGADFENPIPYLSVILPIGLSFHTFQAMSYTIEIYRGEQPAEKHFGIFSLYVMFYPQLVAGPIERPQNLLPQFRKKHSFDYANVVDGLKMMLWGLFIKIVIADRLAIYVDAVYNNPGQHNGTTLIVATVFFAFQIYCDFAGYSSIAIGAAKVMGFKLMTNFNRPYLSRNISEFWKRWHISLSTWFRDYLYISLGGNRVTVPRWYFNLFFVFVVSGLWHGANWTFILWGALNGFYLVFAIIAKPVNEKIGSWVGIKKHSAFNTFLQIVITFILSCFAWVFFRANHVSDAFDIIGKMFSPSGSLYIGTPSTMIFSVFGIIFLLIAELKAEFFPHGISLVNNTHRPVRYLSYSLMVILILLIGVFDGGQFIYFQF